MAYTIIPNPTDKLKNSQSQIKANFQSISDAFNVNHVDFNTPTNFGKHNFLSMPEQGAAGPATLGNEGALYTKEFDNSVTLSTQLFWRPENTAAGGTEVAITGAKLTSGEGWFQLPSGLIVKYGTKTGITIGTPIDVTFATPTGIPIFTQPPFQVHITTLVADGFNNAAYGSLSTGASLTTTGFRMVLRGDGVSGSGFAAQWIAIGI